MANNYSITFVSLRGEFTYTVHIGGGSGTEVPLKGGSSPFVTQEDDSEDMFTNIRTQSGYLRIVDDGKDANGNTIKDGDGNDWPDWWKDLIPATDTSRPVTLTRRVNNTNVVMWQGFMQAQDFGSALYGNPQEREFPIQCVLTVTQGADINYQHTDIENFAYLLLQIVDSVPSAQRPSNFVIQGGADARNWLLKRIDWQNFVSDDANGPTARYTMYQCLEDMCRFWGWTARTCGTTMYLTCADDSAEQTFLTLTYGQLGQLAVGTTAGDTNGTFSTVDFDTIGASYNIFANTGQEEYVQRGYNKATVNADCNAYNGDLYQSFPDAVVKQMEDGGWGSSTQYGDITVRYTNDVLTFDGGFMSAVAVSGSGSFNLAEFFKINQDIDRNEVVRILKSYSGTKFASLESRYGHMFDGHFKIKCDIYQRGTKYQENRGFYNKTMRMAVGIGSSINNAQWYDGNYSWGSTRTIFKCLLGYEDGYLHFTNGSLAWDTLNVGPAPKAGKLFIEFYGSEDLSKYDGQRLFDIAGLTIEYKRSEFGFGYREIERNTNNVYVATNNSNFHNTWESDCIYASDNDNAFGFGTIINPNDIAMTTVPYGNTTERPEQHLANRVTSFWARSRRRLRTELLANVAMVGSTLIRDITPQYLVTMDGVQCHPLAISHAWRDDIVQLTLLDIEN